MQSIFVRPELRSARGGLRPSARGLRLAGCLFLAGAATASLATAQTARRTVWDGAYTEAQAARATMAFGTSCAGCHSLGTDGRAPLAGDAFWKSFAQKDVSDLLEFVTKYMPNGTPGSLSESTYDDIVALILKSNGFPAGPVELARNTAAGVKIIPKDGGTELTANTLARVVGCLAPRSGTDWVVTSATTPERAEGSGAVPEDATRALGTRSMTLKFVLTRLDALVGARVAVSGLLIGAGGADGINVTAVTRVADKCP